MVSGWVMVWWVGSGGWVCVGCCVVVVGEGQKGWAVDGGWWVDGWWVVVKGGWVGGGV